MANKLKELWDNFPLRFMIPYMQYEALPLKGQVKSGAITTSDGQEQRYLIYLPESYDNGTRYATLYHLHGAGLREAWLPHDLNAVASAHEKAVAAGESDPMIIVAPPSLSKFSMWSDSHDGSLRAASAVVQDLIPHIDEMYPTRAEKQYRAIQGFSMGGFGAMMMSFKYPDLFSKVVSWDGALHNWESIVERRKPIAKKVFGDSAYFDEWSPFALSEAHPNPDLNIEIITGWVVEYGQRYRNHLSSVGVTPAYSDTGCGHVLFCMLEKEGDRVFADYGRWQKNTNN